MARMVENKMTSPKNTFELRCRAEAMDRHRSANDSELLETMSLEQTRKLLHELSVHQIELEIQNEELRRSQMELKTLQERYFDLYNLAPVGYCTLSEKGLILDINLTGTTLLGMAKGKLLKRLFTNFILPEDQDIYYRHSKAMFATTETQACELRMVKNDGTVFWVRLEETTAEDNSGAPVYRIVLVDITANKQAEETLRESEEIFNHFMENSPIYVFFKDLDIRAIRLSKNYEQLLGRPLKEILGKTMDEIFPPELAKQMIADDKKILNEGKHVVVDEQLNGRYYTTIKFPIITNNRPTYLAGYTIDITEHRKAEAERERLITAIEQSGEAIIITDPEGTIQYVNQTFEKETGYTREEVLGQNTRILKSGKQGEDFYHLLWSTITGGDAFVGRIVNKRKDGTLYTEDSTISPVFDAGGKIVNYVAVSRDVTEHILLESKFRQAQKMESIGRLAGGVAHDYNNMLGVILGYTELLMEKVDPAGPLHGDLQEILNAGKRSADITRQLLAFARKQAIIPETISLNKAVGSMLKMLRHLIGEDIQLTCQPATTLWLVRIDPSQIDQLLANLCVNARDAITGVGKININTNEIVLDRAFCAHHTGAKPGEYVLLTFKDNGCGMSKDVQDKIFEPFFTTKAKDQGTGLGLASVYGIVKQNNGFISVSSEPGRGSTFKIYLPRYIEAQKGQSDTPEATKIAQGRGQTVLIVEDEHSILMLVRKMVQELGYIVLTAATPDLALELTQNHPGKIELLLTDVVMPVMNGRDLADRLKILLPDLKVLYMSGYTADVDSRQEVLGVGAYFIEKPFSKMDLATKIGDVLNQSLD